MNDSVTDYGFKWGPLEVSRMAKFEPRKGQSCHIVEVATDHHKIEVYVSKTGRSVRVFRNGEEVK